MAPNLGAKTTTLSEWFRSSSSSPSLSPSILLMDGGVSTHLEGLIAPAKFSHRALWSSSLLLTPNGRETIVQGHKDWLSAGVNIITTVTYQCHYGVAGGFSGGGADAQEVYEREENMTELIRTGVALAQRALQEDVNDATATVLRRSSTNAFPTFVVASTGPYGAAMADGSEYTGVYPPNVTRQVLVDFHRRKAQTLWNTKPNGLAAETIPNLEEVGVVCQVLKELQEQGQKVTDDNETSRGCCWISLACKNGTQLNDGHSVQEALDMIRSYDPKGEWISAVGINCCDGAFVAPLVELLANEALNMAQVNNDSTTTTTTTTTHTPRGIVVYPNSGEAWDAAHEEWKDGTGTTDTQFADRLMAAVQTVHELWKTKGGAQCGHMPRMVLGGCCRTNPATIETLRWRIDAWEEQHLPA